MMTRENEFIAITEEQAKKSNQTDETQFVLREGEEVTVKGIRCIVTLITPPRIVLKAIKREDLRSA